MKKKLFMLGAIIFAGIIMGTYKTKINASTEIKSPAEVQKAIVCLVGYDYSAYLEYAGYEIVDNPVNFAICNKYTVKYERENTIYKKIVEVVDKDTLCNLGYYQFNTIDFLPQSNNGTRLLTSAIYDNKTYLIYFFYDIANERTTGDAYLIVKEENEIILEKHLYKLKEKEPKKILVNEDSIYILGHTSNDNTNIYIERYDHQGVLQNENELIGNESDQLNDAVLIDEYLYITGVTTSADHYYLGTRKGLDGFIMRLNAETLVYSAVNFVSKEGIDKITNLATDGTNLYFISQYIQSETPYAVMYLMNKELGIRKSITMSTEVSYDVKDIKIIGDNIYILNTCYSYNYERQIGRVSIHNLELRKVKDINYLDEDFYKVEDITSDNGTDFSVIITTRDEENELGFTTIKYLDKVESYRISQKWDNVDRVSYANMDGNKIYLEKDNRLVSFSITNVKINDFGKFKNQQLKDYQVIINAKTTLLDNDLSSLKYDDDVYGTYKLICGFKTENLDLLYTIDHIVTENFNVKINEIYDTGFILEFNGIGYLNGEQINNGYTVTKEGTYTLEVYGNNEIKREINFKIEHHQLEYEIIKNTNFTIQEPTLNVPKDTQSIIYQVNDTAENKINYPRKNNWLMVIPVFSSVVVAFAIIRFH